MREQLTEHEVIHTAFLALGVFGSRHGQPTERREDGGGWVVSGHRWRRGNPTAGVPSGRNEQRLDAVGHFYHTVRALRG
jgi:hypothetical protein